VGAKSNRVLAAVHGNDSVEVLDVARGRRIQSIHAGFIKPQMAAYIPESNRIVVSNEGDGTCKIFDATTYKLVDTVKIREAAKGSNKREAGRPLAQNTGGKDGKASRRNRPPGNSVLEIPSYRE
jgi:DNA-binding beta-propeller fold protein YncE